MVEASRGGGAGGGGSDAKEALRMVGCATWQRSPLMVAARHGQIEVVERFLETSCQQPQLDVVDKDGDTALIIAAREGHEDVVKALVGAGADLAVKNSERQSAVDVAKTEAIAAMLKKGEAKMEALLQAILSGGKGGPLPSFGGSSGAGGSGSGMRGECPF
mmetsp:Transcript_88829/g.287219  ORF Transcript_88829/g.287219 Transcript_88829/m.287219 type:complete len:161 (+) Transcript_88829:137-619(+)